MTYPKTVLRAGIGLLVGAALGACSHTPPRAGMNAGQSPFAYGKGDFVVPADNAPQSPLSAEELAMLQDAVPSDEPLSRYGNTSPYTVLGKTYNILAKTDGFSQSGRFLVRPEVPWPAYIQWRTLRHVQNDRRPQEFAYSLLRPRY